MRGLDLGDLGAARQLPYLSFSKLREYVCRSKLNLCITRRRARQRLRVVVIASF